MLSQNSKEKIANKKININTILYKFFYKSNCIDLLYYYLVYFYNKIKMQKKLFYLLYIKKIIKLCHRVTRFDHQKGSNHRKEQNQENQANSKSLTLRKSQKW